MVDTPGSKKLKNYWLGENGIRGRTKELPRACEKKTKNNFIIIIYNTRNYLFYVYVLLS